MRKEYAKQRVERIRELVLQSEEAESAVRCALEREARHIKKQVRDFAGDKVLFKGESYEVLCVDSYEYPESAKVFVQLYLKRLGDFVPTKAESELLKKMPKHEYDRRAWVHDNYWAFTNLKNNIILRLEYTWAFTDDGIENSLSDIRLANMRCIGKDE